MILVTEALSDPAGGARVGDTRASAVTGDAADEEEDAVVDDGPSPAMTVTIMSATNPTAPASAAYHIFTV